MVSDCYLGETEMNVRTESRILLTTLILAGMGAGCYILSFSTTYWLFGLTLLVLGIGLLLWVWKPWKHLQGKGKKTSAKKSRGG